MPSETSIERAEALIEALPYIQKYRGHTFVIKYGGSAMDDEDNVERLLRDIVFLEAVGINPVLIHGGGKTITDRMREVGLKARFVNGLRVTDEQSIAIVEDVLDNDIRPSIAAKIEEFGGKAQGISGKTVFVAEKCAPQHEGKVDVDLGFVGEVTTTNIDEVLRVVGREVVPVISPIALGADGIVLNVNADIAAGALAGALAATKLIYLSDVPGIMRDPKQKDSLIPTVTRESVNTLIKEEIIEGGMIPKVNSALAALDKGVSKVHFIDGRVPHALLLEVFTASGIGTEILP